MSEIEQKVKLIIAERLGLGQTDIRTDANIKTDLGADSLDEMELVMELEEQFAFDISDNDIAQISNVGALIDYVTDRRRRIVAR